MNTRIAALVAAACCSCVFAGKGGGGSSATSNEYATWYNDAFDASALGDKRLAANDDQAADSYKEALDYLEKARTELDRSMKAHVTYMRYRVKPTVNQPITDVQLSAKIDALRDHVKQQMGVGIIVTRDKSETLRALATAKNWLDMGDKAGSAEPTKAYRAYKESEHTATTQLFKVAAAKQAKQWKDGQRYQASDGVITEAELLARLGKVREDASARARSIEQPAFAAWTKKYGKLSEGQKRMLVADGDPPSLNRAKCWVYPTDDEPVCWDAKGNRKFRKRKAAAARPRPRGGGGEQGGGDESGNDLPECSNRAELENATDHEIHYNACGDNGPLNSNTTMDIDANCALEVEGQNATPKPCQHCTFNGSLSCQ